MTLGAFRGHWGIAAVNVLAVAASLAAATSAGFHALAPASHLTLVTGAPTLFFGLLWAAALRSRVTLAGSVRVGWLASLPLAALDAGTVAGLLVVAAGAPTLGKVAVAALIGASFGAIVWVPALSLALLCFGLPIARAQQLARRGLAGEESGEVVVGLASAALAAFAAVLAARARGESARDLAVVLAFAALGAVAGLAAATAAAVRERARRRFVAAVEAGRVEGFRVEPRPEGKVLVELVARGAGYRVADEAEELAALDEEGAVTVAARAAVDRRGPRPG